MVFSKWALEITAEHQVYFGWPVKVMAGLGGEEFEHIEEEYLRSMGDDFLHMKKALFPLSAEKHWCLLVIDMEMKTVRVVDTLYELKPGIVKSVETLLRIWREIQGLEWLEIEAWRKRSN